MAMIQTLSQSLPSSLDYKQTLETLGDKVNRVVRADKFYIFTLNEAEHSPGALLFGAGTGEEFSGIEVDVREYPIVQECVMKRSPLIQRNAPPKQLFAGEPQSHEGFA